MDAEYLQYRAIDLFSRAVPRRFAYGVGDLLAGAMYAGDTKGRAAVTSNLRRILAHKGLQPTEEELEGLAQETYRNFAKYLVDFFKLRKMSRETVEKLIEIENPHFVEQAVALGRGGIALCAHLSSWELAAAALTARGQALNVVFFPLQSSRAAELFRQRREERGEKLIPLGRAAVATLGALRKNEWVALLGDVDFSPRDDVVDFCGAPARLPMGPARLCVKLKTPILPGFIVRKPDDTFRLRFHPPIIPDTTSTVEEVRERTRAIVEREVMENPTHWFVFIDFWDLEASRSLAIKRF